MEYCNVLYSSQQDFYALKLHESCINKSLRGSGVQNLTKLLKDNKGGLKEDDEICQLVLFIISQITQHMSDHAVVFCHFFNAQYIKRSFNFENFFGQLLYTVLCLFATLGEEVPVDENC